MEAINQLDALRETVRLAEERGMPEMPGSELGLAHLRSILSTVNKSKFTDAKLGRWLGWAQCALVASGVGVTLDDMKALNLRHKDTNRIALHCMVCGRRNCRHMGYGLE